MAAGKAEPATRSPAIRRTRDAPLPPLAGLAHAYPNATSPDLASAVLSIAGLGLLVWSLIEAPARGWTSARVLAAGIGGLAVLAVFAWWERRSAHPMLNMDLFRKRELSGAVTSQALAVFGFYGALFLLTQFLQFSLGYSALRAGVCSALEVKSYLGSPGILDLPGGGCGRLESWRKWSFPAGLPGHGGAGPPGWAVAGKSRRGSWFPLASRPDLSQVWPLAVVAGCMAELTEVWVRGEAWWSAGFEAAGPVRLLRGAVEHAADLVFAQALPPGVQVSLGSSRSYAHWLGQRPAWLPRAQLRSEAAPHQAGWGACGREEFLTGTDVPPRGTCGPCRSRLGRETCQTGRHVRAVTLAGPGGCATVREQRIWPPWCARSSGNTTRPRVRRPCWMRLEP